MSPRLLAALLFLGALLSFDAQAKRLPPPVVRPQVIQGVTYSLETHAKKKWFVFTYWVCEVVLTRDGAELWRKEVYAHRLDPTMETDAQETYPKTMTISFHKIPNEKGEYTPREITVMDEAGKYFSVPIRE
jgi:hypothetical protein